MFLSLIENTQEPLTLDRLREIAVTRQIPDWAKLSELQLLVAIANTTTRYVEDFSIQPNDCDRLSIAQPIVPRLGS